MNGVCFGTHGCDLQRDAYRHLYRRQACCIVARLIAQRQRDGVVPSGAVALAESRSRKCDAACIYIERFIGRKRKLFGAAFRITVSSNRIPAGSCGVSVVGIKYASEGLCEFMWKPRAISTTTAT